MNYTVAKFWVEMDGSDKWIQLVGHVTIQRHIDCINKLLRVLNKRCALFYSPGLIVSSTPCPPSAMKHKAANTKNNNKKFSFIMNTRNTSYRSFVDYKHFVL